MIVIEKKINHDNRYFIFRQNGAEIEVDVQGEKVKVIPKSYGYKKEYKNITTEECKAVLNFSKSN